MIYDIRQTTTYEYASKVSYAHHVLRLMLINRTGQRVHAAALEIFPVPVERREGFDFFGNHVTWIGLEESHDKLTIKVAARVAVEALPEPAPLATPAWEEVRAAVMMTSDIGPTSPAHFLFPSHGRYPRSRYRRLCARELFAGPARLRRRDRPHEPHQGRFRLRAWRHQRRHHAIRGVQIAARRLPGFCPYHDLRPARHRAAGRLCERLSANSAERGAKRGSKAPMPCMPG